MKTNIEDISKIVLATDILQKSDSGSIVTFHSFKTYHIYNKEGNLLEMASEIDYESISEKILSKEIELVFLPSVFHMSDPFAIFC